MDTKKYKSRSIYIEHIKKAERYGKTINEYISYLEKLSVENKNKEVELELEKIKSL